jgi:hypothetical protein
MTPIVKIKIKKTILVINEAKVSHFKAFGDKHHLN